MGGLNIFARKWGGGGGGGNGNFCLKKVGLSYYTEVFLEIPDDATEEKNLDVFIFPLLTNTCYKLIT